MKNFVLIGRLWQRALEFVNEASADRYIAQHCQDIAYEKCSQAEVETRFADFKKKYSNYVDDQHDIRGMIILQS